VSYVEIPLVRLLGAALLVVLAIVLSRRPSPRKAS
jgi:hypothetical protein